MAEWTLMNEPMTRTPGPRAAPGEPGSYSAPINVTTEASVQSFLSKPDSPLFLWLGRHSATTTTLKHGVTDTVLYKIRDTGRGSLSSKPDFEIFRQTSNSDITNDGLFVGSIRFGRRDTELKFPLSGKKSDNIESFDCGGKGFKWETTLAKRDNKVVRTQQTEEERKASGPNWIMQLDCLTGSNGADDASCSVKLFDFLPNGRIEVWDQDIAKCAKGDGNDGGEKGAWDALDEMVTVAYANMEKTRRKMMMKGDPKSNGIAGLGMGGAVM